MQGYLGRYLPGSPGTETGLKRLGTTCAQVPSFPFLPAEYSLHLHGTAPVRTQHTLLTVYTHSRASCAMLCAASIWPCTLCSLALFAVEMAVTATYAREYHRHIHKHWTVS